MKNLLHPWRLLAITAVLALGVAAVAEACNVPVFRFALERWRADAYRATIFHRGPLTDGQRELIRSLEGPLGKRPGNVAVRVVDVSRLENATEENAGERLLLALVDAEKLPQIVVQYPQHLRIEFPAWAGPLNRDSISRLIDSPARQELARRLAKGQAVWLLLESGQPEKDEAAADLLEAELRRLEQELKLPELTSDPDDALLTTPPLVISFSMLRVSRSSAEEQALVGMLIRSEPDLAERNDPLVFPVFGRGRAMWALVGAGISAKNIHDAAEFVVGPCSCQVKEQNPGFDLLLATDWEALLSENGVALAAIETRAPQAVAGEPELVPIPGGAPVTQGVSSYHPDDIVSNGPDGGSWRLVGIASLLVVVLLAGGIFAAARLGPQR